MTYNHVINFEVFVQGENQVVGQVLRALCNRSKPCLNLANTLLAVLYAVGSQVGSQGKARSRSQQHRVIWMYAAVGWQSRQKSGAHGT